jgi:hypothetical protein
MQRKTPAEIMKFPQQNLFHRNSRWGRKLVEGGLGSPPHSLIPINQFKYAAVSQDVDIHSSRN